MPVGRHFERGIISGKGLLRGSAEGGTDEQERHCHPGEGFANGGHPLVRATARVATCSKAGGRCASRAFEP